VFFFTRARPQARVHLSACHPHRITELSRDSLGADFHPVLEHKMIHSKFQTCRDELNAALIDRDDEIQIALVALVANEHAVFVGPPGTAKSLLSDSIVGFLDCRKYSVLLNKFSKPEEVYGPVDVMALKSGVFRRITTGMLPECEVAFLDEAFKASSAILNTTLKLLNEGLYQNGDVLMKCPLRLCIAASNEWPTEAKELGALFDRFLFRKLVLPVTGEADIERLMFSPSLTPSLSVTLSMAELDMARSEARLVTFDADTKVAMATIRQRVTAQGVVIGDRRLRKTAGALQCAAWLDGRMTVETDDLALLSHIWWSHPDQMNVVADAVTEIARPSQLLASQLLADANELIRTADPRQLEECAVISIKLKEIAKRLDKMSGDRPKKVYSRVVVMMKQLRLQTIEAHG
jgi:MoxR-like ATPase